MQISVNKMGKRKGSNGISWITPKGLDIDKKQNSHMKLLTIQ